MSGGDAGPFDFSCNVTHVDTIPTPNFVTDAQAAQLIASGQINGLKKFTRNFFGSGKAIMPDGVMQRMRVGAANGLGAKYLAREDAREVAILGSGWQAGAQLMAASATYGLRARVGL